MGINISSRLKRPIKPRLKLPRPKSKKARISLLAAVLLFAGFTLFFIQNRQDTTQAPEETGPLNFHVLREDRKGSSLKRLLVYTTEKSDKRLIQLNDQLIASHNEGFTRLYIEYHNNMETAVKSYDQQIDPSTRDREKDPFFDHFVASMTYSTNGNKQLTREGRQPKLLKQY